MGLKDIVVFVDNRPACAERLRVASALARRFGAHLTGVHVTGFGPIPPMLDGVGVEQIMAMHSQLAATEAAEAEGKFRELMRRDNVSHDWQAIEGPIASIAARAAHGADLAIAGQTEPGTDNAVLPEEVALLSGRPVLVIPYAGSFDSVGENPIIAWKPTREAARAVHDALPLMAGAKQATIIVVDPEQEPGESEVGDRLAAHLARHQINAVVERTVSGDIPVSDVFLSRAADLSSDLLVMGCYGHSRLREFVLGGVTREILAHMTLPVLLSH